MMERSLCFIFLYIKILLWVPQSTKLQTSKLALYSVNIFNYQQQIWISEKRREEGNADFIESVTKIKEDKTEDLITIQILYKWNN